MELGTSFEVREGGREREGRRGGGREEEGERERPGVTKRKRKRWLGRQRMEDLWGGSF